MEVPHSSVVAHSGSSSDSCFDRILPRCPRIMGRPANRLDGDLRILLYKWLDIGSDRRISGAEAMSSRNVTVW